MTSGDTPLRSGLYDEIRQLARQQASALRDDDLDRFSVLMDQREAIMARLEALGTASREESAAGKLSGIIAEIAAVDHENKLLLTRAMHSTQDELLQLSDGLEATRAYAHGLRTNEARYLDKSL